MACFESYRNRAVRKYGEQFEDSALSPQFVQYFNSGERIRVRSSYGEELTGTVGATTGWRPVFLLLRRPSDSGSSNTLSDTDTVIAIKRGRSYVPVNAS